MIKRTILFLHFFIISSFIFSQEVTLIANSDTGELLYSSSEDIYGMQFNHPGCASGASGGDHEVYELTISATSGMVLTFDFGGGFIPAGSGVLLENVFCEADDITSLVVSGASGSQLTTELANADDGGDVVFECSDGSSVCLITDSVTGELLYSSSEDIYGMQFNHPGCASGASG